MTSSANTAGYAENVTSAWTASALETLTLDHTNQAPQITSSEAKPVSPELDVWDAWPLADAGGVPVDWRGGELWFALAAPRAADPEHRHHLARIHHFHRIGERFHHVARTLPEDFAPGAREWSGSARLEEGIVTLYFTAAGRKGDRELTYHQRIFSTQTALDDDCEFTTWSDPVEIIAADSHFYRPADENEGEAGKIKAFRDPSYFRDRNGAEYILFTGSSASQPGAHDGVIGGAVEEANGEFRLLPPLLQAIEVNNELERPHIVEHAGALYLFWSTQRGVFAPGVSAPTGLYGATAKNIEGPWTLLNGHGLVIANPADRPTQAYSWWVLPDLTVTSFVDYWGPEEPHRPEIETRRARFGGTFAPFLRIALDGARSRLERG